MSKTITASVPDSALRRFASVRRGAKDAASVETTAIETTVTGPADEVLPVTIIAQDEYDAMIEHMEDLEALAAYRSTRDEESLPSEIVNALLDGENALKVWRKHRGVTQQALAKAAGKSKSYICEIEAGKKSPSVKTLKALAKALDCGLDDLA